MDYKLESNIITGGYLPRIDPTAEDGLTSAQAAERIQAGYANLPVDAPTKTVKQIIKSNVLTYFNMLFVLLAVCIIMVGSWRDLMFMPVIIINSFIGIVQELRAKKTLDKLTLLSEPTCPVIRDGSEITLHSSELVLDDVVIFASGMQICADAVILQGDVQVNEALITGEADEISKNTGDNLLSGSFVVSGSCRAKLERVGANSFASQLTIEARRSKKLQQSEMMKSLTRLVQIIGILIIPLGVLLFYNHYVAQGLDLQRSVKGSVAALVGMIPEGLYLLTSIALALGVIRLAKRKTLIHELGCIETLARVDVLCVDKTGTITEPEMIVEKLILLCEDRFSRSDVEMIISDHISNLGSENETMKAMEQYFPMKSMRHAIRTIPFTSKTKFSGTVYEEDETYLVGAPEIILGDDFESFASQIEPYSQEGYRVLLLAMYDGEIAADKLDGHHAMPLALILLSNKIRADAEKTFRFFAEQGVTIKVISGDNPMTVSNIAKKAGIADAERYVDAQTLDTEAKLKSAALQYTVFGRVTPEQKRKLVRALKNAGRTVAMTGDGVNDVLALKDADCSIAMASGSDVACQVSQIVLMNSDFSAMPSVVMEGRRVINNIQRSATLFLVKNIFSFTLAIISMIAVLPYPVSPSQLSMVSMITIGIPSFFLALEPNNAIVKGHFLRNVLVKALPGGLSNVILVLGVVAYSFAFSITQEMMSTICAILLAINGIIVLLRVCRPFTSHRRALCIFVMLVLAFAIAFLKDIFALSPLNFGAILVLVTMALLAYPAMETIYKSFSRLSELKSTLLKHGKHRK